MLSILLLKEWFRLKKSLLALFILLSMLPMVLHLFNSIPLSNIVSLDMRYQNWSGPGIWVTSSCMLTFINSVLRIKHIKSDTRQLESLLKAPIKNSDIIHSISLLATFMGLLQLVFSIFITVLLNNEYLTILQILFIIIQLFPLLLFFAFLGTLLGIFLKSSLYLIYLSIMLFLILSFSIGAFIPLHFFPSNYISIINNLPFSMIVYNCQLIIQNNDISYIGVIIMLFIDLFLVLFANVAAYRTFRK